MNLTKIYNCCVNNFSCGEVDSHSGEYQDGSFLECDTMTLCSLVDRYQLFSALCFLCLQGTNIGTYLRNNTASHTRRL